MLSNLVQYSDQTTGESIGEEEIPKAFIERLVDYPEQREILFLDKVLFQYIEHHK